MTSMEGRRNGAQEFDTNACRYVSVSLARRRFYRRGKSAVRGLLDERENPGHRLARRRGGEARNATIHGRSYSGHRSSKPRVRLPAIPRRRGRSNAPLNLYARAFSAARVYRGADGGNHAVELLALIARNMIRRGDSLHVIELRRGSVDFLPAGSWDVRGAWDEAGWFYRCDLFGPSGNITRLVSGAAALCIFATPLDPARPWHGIGPLGWARETAALQGESRKATLPRKRAAPTGARSPGFRRMAATADDDDPLALLKADIAGAKGRTILTETTASGMGRRFEPPLPDPIGKATRIGAHPPDVLRGLA